MFFAFSISSTDFHMQNLSRFNSEKLEILDDDEKLKLLKRVREKDPEAIEKMILSHIRLAFSIVNRYISVFPHFVKDLDSAAMLGIVIAVNKIAQGSMAAHNNVTGYIVINVNYAVRGEIQKSFVIRAPRNKKVVKVTNDLRQGGMLRHSQLSNQLYEIWDTVDSLTEDQLEKQILELRGEGHTDVEVAEFLGLTRSSVTRIRQSLFKKYKRKEEK